MDRIESISVKDVDYSVRSLRPLRLEDVGGSECLKVAYHCERLALQLHTQMAEVVVQAARMHQTIPILVENVLVMELWRRQILKPFAKAGTFSLASKLAANDNVIRCCFLLNMETTMVVLLNAFLMDYTAELKEETLVALIDYCARCMATLLQPEDKVLLYQKQQHTVNLARDGSLGRIQAASLDAEFRTCVVASTALVRNFCEGLESLSVGAQTRIMDKHDFLLVMVSLIEEPPWTRQVNDKSSSSDHRRRVGWEKFVENEWKPVLSKDLFNLSPCEGNCWINVFCLTCMDTPKKKYEITARRQSKLLRLQKLLQVGSFVEQLSVLADIQQYMNALSELHVPDNNTSSSEEPTLLFVEQIDTMMESLWQGRDWDKLSHKLFESHFAKVHDDHDTQVQELVLLHVNSGLPGLVPTASSAPLSSNKNKNANNKNDDQSTVDASQDILLEMEAASDNSPLWFRLSFVDEGTTTTSEGTLFRRRKLGVRSVDAGPKVAACVALASPATATVPIVGSTLRTKLELDSIGLVQSESETGARRREWRQVGSTDSGLVLQLGFKLSQTESAEGIEGESPVCCVLDKAFLSDRVSEAVIKK